MRTTDGQDWWVDDPIESAEADGLGRVGFVERAVEILGSVRHGSSSTVLAVIGSWGSGKTSTVNLILRGLEESEPPGWGIARLNPWALGSAEAIMSEVLHAIGTALPPDGATATKARRLLKNYGKYAALALSVVPAVGKAMADMGKAALDQYAGNDTLESRFRELVAAMKLLDRPTLLFIDDVDRLQPDELLALFRAIRVLGRLPNVHYVIAYDQRTLIDLLKATPLAADREDRALSFLEKIVNIRLEQPQVRVDQTAELFNDGLTDLLVDVRARLTADVRRRLREEWDHLLAPDLREPRSVSRFLVQLRIYLPLVGYDEIDFVDWVAISHLRLAYPSVYRALDAHRVSLTGGVVVGGDGQAWRVDARVDDLPVAVRRRVTAAVDRLFPAVDGEGPAAAALRDARRRDRRASDPDYVERYFSLVLSDPDLSDAALLRALADLVAGRGTREAGRLAAALRPAPDDPRLCARSAGVLRRADALTESSSAEQAGELLGVVVSRLPFPEGAGAGIGSPAAAAVAWIGRLIDRAGEFPAPLAGSFDGLSVAGLTQFVRSLRQDAPAADWRAALVMFAVDHAWSAFVRHVRAGDDAIDDPAELFGFVEDVLGATAVDDRLRRAVGSGLPVAHLAARFVEVGTDLADGRPSVLGFDANLLLRRLGAQQLAEHLGRSAEQDDAEPGDEFDVSWANRRMLAMHALIETLGTKRVRPPARLPVIPEVVTHPFVSHRVDLLRLPGDRRPDFSVEVAVLVPGGTVLPSIGRAGPVVTGSARERIIMEELTGGPITRWQQSAAENWHAVPEEWRITDGGDGSNYTTMNALAAMAGWTPILLGARVQTGLADDHPALLGDFTTGIELNELDRERRPTGVRQTLRPLPAAMSLQEAYELTLSMVRCADIAVRCYEQLISGTSGSPGLVMQVRLVAPDGIAAVVDLSSLRTVGTGNSRPQQHVAHLARARPRLGGLSNREFVVGMLGEWMLRSGYRDYEHHLLRLLDR